MIWTRRDGGRNPKHAAQGTSSLERDAFPTVDCARVRNWGGGAPTPAQATRDPPRRSRLPGRAVDRPLSNMTIGMVLRRMAVPVTVHGFRSTFRVWVEETTNTPVPVSEAALSHAMKDKVMAADQRSDLLETRVTSVRLVEIRGRREVAIGRAAGRRRAAGSVGRRPDRAGGRPGGAPRPPRTMTARLRPWLNSS
jgi:hypothetical protein